MKIDFNRLKKCLIVAEISANHGQDFRKAVTLIKKAKECGADAVKFQAYTPKTMTLNIDSKYFRIEHPEWGGQTLFELYKKAYTPWRWFKKLKKTSDELGIIFFAAAFDKTSVDFLEELGVPFHKIASFELVDLPLIEYASRTKKPLILSTGMATISEIHDAVSTAKKAGCNDIAILKCVSSYPADPRDMNLKTIPDMERRFKCPIGLSDHSLSTGVSVAAVSLGAKIIEKHFILSRRLKTPDSFFSIEPHEFKELVNNIRMAQSAMGKVRYGLTKNEKGNRIFRRSLFCIENISKGEYFSEANIASIRPASGIKPKYLRRILYKKARINIAKGTPLQWRMVT